MWSNDILRKHFNSYKRINKDDLRKMLDDGQHSRSAEGFVLKVRNSLILQALDAGKNVIVDDTNLNPIHERDIRTLVKGKAEVEIEDFTHVAVEVCIANDLTRPKSVGQKVIRGMYNQYLHEDVEKIQRDIKLPDVVICDLDGTLSLMNGRDPYDASTCNDDILNEPVYEVIQRENVILLSGRSNKYRPQTEEFLAKYGVKYWGLYMRAEEDMRKDCTVKQELYENHIKGKYNVKFIFEDRNQVVDMWRSLGLAVFQVADGDF